LHNAGLDAADPVAAWINIFFVPFCFIAVDFVFQASKAFVESSKHTLCAKRKNIIRRESCFCWTAYLCFFNFPSLSMNTMGLFGDEMNERRPRLTLFRAPSFRRLFR